MDPIPEENTSSLPRKCDNPWKPNKHDKETEVYRRMMGILNRVTKQSIHILLPQALELPICQPQHLSSILSLLLTKAQDEPLFTQTYALFCSELVKHIEIKDPLVDACWNHFSESLSHLRGYIDIFEAIGQNLSISLIQEEILCRKRLGVHIAFVCCLERNDVVPFDQLALMTETLLSHGDWRSIDCLCRLLSFAGERLATSQEDLVERCCTELQNLLNSGSLSMRMTFLVEATLELKNNGWRRQRHRTCYGGRTGRG